RSLKSGRFRGRACLGGRPPDSGLASARRPGDDASNQLLQAALGLRVAAVVAAGSSVSYLPSARFRSA
ncbi:MAG: hypothetical protein ACRDYC_03950, partial [Acidimicrobiales bacterium]